MELLQLRYFQALARNEHLTNTAKELMISAPSLRASIARLERELGVKLFDKIGRNITLNHHGHLLLDSVNVILSTLDNTCQQFREVTQASSTSVTIGITAPTLWMDAIQAFSKINSNIIISHEVVKINLLNNANLNDNFDFLIGASEDIPGDNLDRQILYPDDKPILVVYPEHPFSAYHEIDFVLAKNEHFIALSRGYASRACFDRLCEKARFIPKISIECDYLLRNKMFQDKKGVFVTTELGWHVGNFGEAVGIRITSPKMPPRRQSMVWDKNKCLSPSALLFLDFMVDYYLQYT